MCTPGPLLFLAVGQKVGPHWAHGQSQGRPELEAQNLQLRSSVIPTSNTPPATGGGRHVQPPHYPGAQPRSGFPRLLLGSLSRACPEANPHRISLILPKHPWRKGRFRKK